MLSDPHELGREFKEDVAPTQERTRHLGRKAVGITSFEELDAEHEVGEDARPDGIGLIAAVATIVSGGRAEKRDGRHREGREQQQHLETSGGAAAREAKRPAEAIVLRIAKRLLDLHAL